MFELNMGQIIAGVMVLGGDLFALAAVGGSFLLLLGALVNARDLAARGAAAGLGGLAFGTWAFVQKLASPGMANMTNGWVFGFGNPLVGVLLVVGALLWIIGMGLLVLRRLA